MGYLVCDKCGEYYELQPGESPEDFTDKCECGGNLKYMQYRSNGGYFSYLDTFPVVRHDHGRFKTVHDFFKNDMNKGFMIFILIIIIPLLFMGVLFKDTFITFTCLGTLLIMSLVFFENKIFSKLEKILNIKLKRDNGLSMESYTYDGRAWLYLIIISLFLIVLFYPVVISHNNFPAYVGLIFTGIYPLVVMIIRRDVFNEGSIPSARNPVYAGSNLVSGGPGYNPIHYLCFSGSIGLASTIWGFSMLNFPDSVAQGFVLVLFGLVFQTLVLFPDVINMVSPWDIRTQKGLLFMTGVNVSIIVFLLVLSGILSTIY